jgi:osmotically-inducible protein OsmY
MMMNRPTKSVSRPTLIVLMGSAVLALSAALTFVSAGELDETTVEQRADSAQGAIKDAWLDGKLESALLFNEHLNSFDIDTDVQNGVAYLRGAVESDIDRDLAGEIAESIKGVTDVENELEVDKSKAAMASTNEESIERDSFRQSVVNATLTARVKTELLLNSNTSGLAINVDSEDGVVTLTGEVESAQERELAARIAGNADGAVTVLNRLTVASSA